MPPSMLRWIGVPTVAKVLNSGNTLPVGPRLRRGCHAQIMYLKDSGGILRRADGPCRRSLANPKTFSSVGYIRILYLCCHNNFKKSLRAYREVFERFGMKLTRPHLPTTLPSLRGLLHEALRFHVSWAFVAGRRKRHT